MSNPRKAVSDKERERTRMALEMIEEAAADAQRANPNECCLRGNSAFSFIYRMAHIVRATKCRKNHAEWLEELDAAIRAEKGRAGE